MDRLLCEHYAVRLKSAESGECLASQTTFSSMTEASSSAEEKSGPPAKKAWRKRRDLAMVPGSVSVLIVCGSVRRSVGVMKHVRTLRASHRFRKQGSKWVWLRCAQLFGKHRKVAEQRRELADKLWHVGVGGPARLHTLCETGALSMDKCHRLVIDLHRNAKQQSLLDDPHLAMAFYRFFHAFCLPRVLSGKLVVHLL